MGLVNDLKNNVEVKEILSSSQRTSDATSSAIDTKNGTSGMVVMHVSGYTDGDHDPQIQSAKDDGTGSPDSSDWSDVPSDQVDGSLPTVSGSGDTGVHKVGVSTKDRHLRVKTSVSGTSTGATYGFLGVLGQLRYDDGGKNPAKVSS